MMNINLNDEILRDFLVEGGEIIEQLGEQLAELEKDPDNSDLLNSIFRGFHTIKGGAGFVNSTAMVNVCHCAEDVFHLLRQGQRQADPELMDAILQVLDIINEMFNQLRLGQEPQPADAELMTQLMEFSDLKQQNESPSSIVGQDISGQGLVVTQSESNNRVGDATDHDFEEFLNEMQEQATNNVSSSPGNDEIGDDEFEDQLDQPHRTGKHGGITDQNRMQLQSAASNDTQIAAYKEREGSDDITEDEFESLCDTVHGAGKALAFSPPRNSAAEKADDLAEERALGNIPGQGILSASCTTSLVDNTYVKPSSESSVRVDTKRLDDIMNLVGELVLVRNRLASLYGARVDENIANTVSNLDMVTSGLQAAVMKTRMQPINKLFGRFPRMVRDMARSLNKEVELVVQGEETDLDQNLVEALADPLVPLVRNAVEHGIEFPHERERVGKPRTGKILLSASQEGDRILLTIEDDGRGMDAEKLRFNAVERGLLDKEAADRLNESDTFNLVFMAGLSTKTEISDISGCSVGMDVVKTRIEQLNGTIEILSERGKGSRLCIKVPLTLAVLTTLMVALGNQRFAIPLSCVDEILDFDPRGISKLENQEVILVRQKALPIFFLRRWLLQDMQKKTISIDSSHVVVLHVGKQKMGFVVDQLIGQEEVVIKPLGAYLQGLPGFAGATITGDGRIALILDIMSLMKANARTVSLSVRDTVPDS
jgi:two-component system chemotaxis sensor kinase CheA